MAVHLRPKVLSYSYRLRFKNYFIIRDLSYFITSIEPLDVIILPRARSRLNSGSRCKLQWYSSLAAREAAHRYRPEEWQRGPLERRFLAVPQAVLQR